MLSLCRSVQKETLFLRMRVLLKGMSLCLPSLHRSLPWQSFGLFECLSNAGVCVSVCIPFPLPAGYSSQAKKQNSVFLKTALTLFLQNLLCDFICVGGFVLS